MTKAIKLEEFTLEELEKLELLTGMTFSEISDDFNRPKVLKAVVWISQLRNNPDAKIEDVAKMTLTEITEIFAGEDDPKAE
jgi:hypothetical protein